MRKILRLALNLSFWSVTPDPWYELVCVDGLQLNIFYVAEKWLKNQNLRLIQLWIWLDVTGGFIPLIPGSRALCDASKVEAVSCASWKFYHTRFQMKLLMRLQTCRTLAPFLLISIGEKDAISSETGRERTFFFSESLWLLCLEKMWDRTSKQRE